MSETEEIPDTLHLECPSCKAFVGVTTYTGPCGGFDFCVEEAPLTMLTEVNEESREGSVGCTSCGMDIALVVRFIAYPMPLSDKQRYSVKWRKT